MSNTCVQIFLFPWLAILKPKDAAYVLIQIQKLALSIFFLEINLEMITKAVLDFM